LQILERKGRFIALGSSGELLPVSRNGGLGPFVPRFCGPRNSLIGKQPSPAPMLRTRISRKASSASSASSSHHQSVDSSDDDDEFHSAKESLDLSEGT